MNHKLDLCLLPAGADEKKVKQRASSLFLLSRSKVVYLGDRDFDWSDVGITVHPTQWSEYSPNFSEASGIILDFRPESLCLRSFVHSPAGYELCEMIQGGVPCLAIGAGAEILASFSLDPDALPTLNILEDEKSCVEAIDACHRPTEEIKEWQKKYGCTVHILEPGGEWLIHRGRSLTRKVEPKSPSRSG